jgi:hypothetical protein
VVFNRPGEGIILRRVPNYERIGRHGDTHAGQASAGEITRPTSTTADHLKFAVLLQWALPLSK